MCSLSQGIAYEARQEGIALGIEQGILKGKALGLDESQALAIIKMIKNISKEDSSKYTNANDEVKQIVEKILKENKYIYHKRRYYKWFQHIEMVISLVLMKVMK